MPLPKELTTVTLLSKLVALLLFILLPIVSFIFGVNYQKTISENVNNSNQPKQACTLEAKICPGGIAVGRTGSNCEFTPCPTLTKTNNQKGFCGGIAGTVCPDGYNCQYDSSYPDAGGTCIKNDSVSKFECPENEWVNCMPTTRVKGGIDANIFCSNEYLTWAKENCPNFKGAAY